MSAASRGPTITFQWVASSITPESGAAYPGMINVRCETVDSSSYYLTASAMTVSESLPAATAVRTDCPSVSTISM